MASLTFAGMYAVDTALTPPYVEANQVDIIYSNLGPVVISDGTTNQYFTGHDVAVAVTVGATTYYGWMTRDVKDGGVVRGFYLWVDPDYHSIADALADPHQDIDGPQDDLGFVLVDDPTYFASLPFLTDNIKHTDTSSEPIADQLNALVVYTPVVTITEDANNDGVINSSELSGNVDVHIALPAGTNAGDTLTVNSGSSTQTFVLTAAQVTGGVDVSYTPPPEGGTITVTAFITSQVGVIGGTGSDSALRDTLAPSAPTVTITEDANNDGVISGPELSGDVNVTIGLPVDAAAGDLLTVTNGTVTQHFTLTSAQVTAGQVLTSFTPPADGATITVTAYVTDPHGNTGPSAHDSAVLETQGPPAPVVTITEDANNDGFLSSSELSGNVDVSIALPSGVVAGDVLHVSDGTTTHNFTLTNAQIVAGYVTTDFAPPAEHGTITVTAYVTDIYGNDGASGSDAATRHSFGPSAPVVTITEDADNNGVITAAELHGNVDVTVALPADAVAGDVLTVSDGTTTQHFTLTSAQITAGQVLTSFVPPGNGATETVYAYVTDQLGNQGATGNDSAVMDTQGPPAPVVTITEDANNDGIILDGELQGNVDVSIALPAEALAGDVLTISNGTTTQNVTLTAAQITAGVVTTSFAPPAEHATITVTAYITDQSNNQGGTGSDSAIVEQFGPAAPTVTITEDANNDGVIVAAELSGNVDVRIGLPNDVLAGDTLTVTDGTTTQHFTLTSAQVAAHEVLTNFAPPAEGHTITVTAYCTDQFAQDGPSASDSALIKTQGPGAPVVTITEDANNDGVISSLELAGNIDVRIDLPAGVIPGNVLHVTDGVTPQAITLTALDISSGYVTTNFASPGQGHTIDVSAYVTDAYGQAGGTGSDSALLDTQGPPAPVVTITEDANNDGIISGTELSGNIDVSVALPAGALPGDVLHVTDGTTVRTFTLTSQQIIAGTVATDFPPPAEHGTITVTAYITDVYGNQGGTGSDSAVLHEFGPSAPVVVITEDANNDGVITGAELSGNIDVSIALPVEAVAGDVLTVGNGTTTQHFTLSAADIAAGVLLTSFIPPSADGPVNVYAYVTDQMGNQGGTGTDSAVLDTQGPPAPVVTITEDANNDGIILDGELQGNVDVSIALPAQALVGDTLTISDGITTQNVTLTAAQITAGVVTTNFAPPAEHATITVTAHITDQFGNQGGTGSDSAILEQLGPGAPVVVITEDANNDGVIVAAELSGNVDVRVTLAGDVLAGDVLTVTDGTTTQHFTLTAADLAAGAVLTNFAPPGNGQTITVTAWATDQFGQDGLSANDSALMKTQGPVAPVVTITEDANNDGVIGGNELSGNVGVQLAVPAGVLPGDVLHVTDGITPQSITLTAQQIASGFVLTEFAPPAEGATMNVSAYITDAFGQDGSTGSDSALRDTLAPTPGVVITEDPDNDGVIEQGELSGMVDASVALAAGTHAGDVLHVSDGITTQTFTLTAQDLLTGTVSTSFAPPAEDQRITLTAWLTDPYANTSAMASDSAVLNLVTNSPVYTIRLENGDHFYTTDAHQAAVMAEGNGNVLEGAQFDSLSTGGTAMATWYQPFTGDWFYGGPGVQPPYWCYQLMPNITSFNASVSGQGPGDTYHLYLNYAGLTQFATAADGQALLGQGYRDLGAAFQTTHDQAFVFDAEGYLVANKGDAQIVALVNTLAQTYASTSDAGFVNAVEEDFLARVQLTGIDHGGAASAADLNAAFGTHFAP